MLHLVFVGEIAGSNDRDISVWTLSHDEVRELEERTGFDLAKRPETFSPPDFVLLSKALSALRTS